ncbi:hypothetical protein FHY33_003133 [Xanthomonas arboricola]|nr:hypothetical protein [Xanthomonas campestris]
MLAALRSSGAPIRQHRRSHGRARQPAIRITRLQPIAVVSMHIIGVPSICFRVQDRCGHRCPALHPCNHGSHRSGTRRAPKAAPTESPGRARLQTRIRIGLVTHAARPATQAIGTANTPLHTTHNACIAAGVVCCVRTAA